MNARAKAFFSLILVLLVGILIGGSVNHLYVSKFSPRNRPDSSDRRPSNRQFPVQEMFERLKLSPDQEKRMRSILERRREDMHAAAQVAAQKSKEAHRAIRKRAHAEILEVLTEDQAREFDEFMRDLRSRWRHRKAKPTETPAESERGE